MFEVLEIKFKFFLYAFPLFFLSYVCMYVFPGLRFELKALQSFYSLSHTSSPFYLVILEMDWLRTVILHISASQVVRIAGMSHWHLAMLFLL
jgi:hypothetical protein